MEVSTLKQQIQTNDLQKMYIFTGQEWKVQQIYIDQIVKVSGKQKKYVDSIKDIFSKMKSKSLIQQNYVYVLRDDKELISNEQAQTRLRQVIGNDIVILLLTNVDKRTKFYKQYSKEIIEFEALKPQVLKKYIQKEISLSDSNCEKLMEVCENDYGRCLLEIDKIKNYIENYYNNDYGADCVEYATGMKVLRITEDKAFEILLKDGTIYSPPYDAIFDFVDAVLRRQTKRAFNLLYQSYAVGEATMVLLSVLYNNAKQVLQVQTCTSKDVSKSTGLTAWQVKCARDKAGYYTDEELMDLMYLIHKCESGIKQGKIEESIALEYILVRIL